MTRSARQAGTGASLPLSIVLARRLEGDGRRCRLHRGLADEDPIRGCHGLQPCCGVDEVAGHHALVHGSDRHGRLTAEHGDAGVEALTQGSHRLGDLETGAHGALGVVLVGPLRPPRGHDGVADELLHLAAVPLDDAPRRVEVARQRVAHELGVAALGEAREGHEVGEEDRHEAPLGHGRVRLRVGTRRLRTTRSGHGSGAGSCVPLAG